MHMITVSIMFGDIINNFKHLITLKTTTFLVVN
jgi:hypothetical protein